MPKGGGGLSCNLCWSELQAPFIVTSCGHAFCEKHKTDASLQASTCPGCGSHLPSHGGMRLAGKKMSLTVADERSRIEGLLKREFEGLLKREFRALQQAQHPRMG